MTDEIRIRLAESRADYDVCVQLQRTVWGLSELETTSAIHFISATFAGGILHIAETAGGRAVGFSFALAAARGGSLHFHSELLAVDAAHQQRGVGIALKWAQRQEALARGARLVTWTFDPMQAKNAHVNLHRLGGTAPAFMANLYGITSAPLHHRLPTDRLVVHWALDDDRVAAKEAHADSAPVEEIPDLPRINDVKWQAGWPVSTDPDLERTEDELLLEIHPEWDVLVGSAPRVAEDWQTRIRAALQHYLGNRYVAVDFISYEDVGRRRPFYVLREG